MAYDKVVDSAFLEAGLTLVGDSIRAKGGTSAKLEFPNGMKAAVEAIDTSEDLDEVLTEQNTAIIAQDDIIAQIQASVANKCLKAGGTSIDIITASSLPATVVENQIVVITDTPAGTIYVDTDEPANPVIGDVWVQVGSSDYGVELSETFRNGLISARQYSGSLRNMLDSYIGINGVWQQFAHGLPVAGTPLEQWTWQQIITLANSGEDVTQYFAVGDEKNLVLTTGEVVPVVIGDFYHNTITETNIKAPIAFTFKNCLNTIYAMDNQTIPDVSWSSSKMRNTHMMNIFNTFPAELRAYGAVKYVDVATIESQQSTSLVTLSDRLRLHSVTELGLTYEYAGIEGTEYAYYASGNRIKTVNGTASNYWTRSPDTGSYHCFCAVHSSGEFAAGVVGTNSHDFAVTCGFDI